MKKTDLVGDVDEALERNDLEVTLSNAFYGKDIDKRRDKEVECALNKLNFERVRDEIGSVVAYTIDAIHDNPRYQRLLALPHYAKIVDDVIMDIYLKHYT